MKIFLLIISFILLISCNGTDNLIGKYDNGQGESLQLKKDNTYQFTDCNGFSRFGKWKQTNKRQVLFYNWIDFKNLRVDQEVTYRNETLWFSPDIYDVNFKKDE